MSNCRLLARFSMNESMFLLSQLFFFICCTSPICWAQRGVGNMSDFHLVCRAVLSLRVCHIMTTYQLLLVWEHNEQHTIGLPFKLLPAAFFAVLFIHLLCQALFLLCLFWQKIRQQHRFRYFYFNYYKSVCASEWTSWWKRSLSTGENWNCSAISYTLYTCGGSETAEGIGGLCSARVKHGDLWGQGFWHPFIEETCVFCIESQAAFA